MEVKISTTVETHEDLKELVKVVAEMEKEHNVSCTLEVSVG